MVAGLGGRDDLEELSRYSELWRFRDATLRAWGPRRQVSEELHPDEQHLSLDFDPSDDAGVIPPVRFEGGRLLGKQWQTLSSRPWGHAENISVFGSLGLAWSFLES